MTKRKPKPEMSKHRYRALLEARQIELVKLQRDVIQGDRRLLILVEGRDAAGKDGLIRAVTEHMSVRDTRVVALPKPSDRERSQWYFQRFVAHLPSLDEIVLFNRSWYNRAGVERVLGFCTPEQVDEFYDSVQAFEGMLVRSGIELTKIYLDVSRGEQKRRLKERKADPLTAWKVSPIDAAAIAKWDEYTAARDEMLRRTHTALAPWTIVKADDKRAARIAVMTNLLHGTSYEGRPKDFPAADPDVAFLYGPGADERLER